MSEEQPRERVNKARERVYALLAISLLVLFAACSGLITALELPLRLALGWIWHLVQVIPPLLPRWHELLLPLACFTVALWMGHRFIRWWLAAKGRAPAWRGRHTLAASLLVLLGAAAAIALSGVVHQVVWLMDEPWYERRGMDRARAEAVNFQRQIHFALVEFRGSEGRDPATLGELDLPKSLRFVSPRDGGLREPILYFKPPENDDGEEEHLLLVSPVLRSGLAVVTWSSGETHTVEETALPKLLKTRRRPAPEPHD